MGEISDMVVSGLLCEVCGCLIDDGQEPGHPRKCLACSPKPRRKPDKAPTAAPAGCRTTLAQMPHVSLTRDSEIAAVWVLPGDRRLYVVSAPDGGLAWVAMDGTRTISQGQFEP